MSVDLLDLSPRREDHSRTWHDAVAEYLPRRHRSWARRNAHHLPLTIILLLYVLLVTNLNPTTAFIDEALYINAGYDYLAYWFSDGPYIDHARGFSGVPYLYPVLAAALDSIGGLVLVRAVSLLLVVTIIVLMGRVAEHVFGYRTGVFTTAAIAFSAPVAFLGQHATHDAPALALVVVALYIGVTRITLRSALAVGTLLAAAMATKYAAAAFAPAVLGAMLFVGKRPWVRTTIAATTTSLAGLTAYLFASNTVLEGMITTTLDRSSGAFGVIAQASPTHLSTLLLGHIGLLATLVIGGVFATRRWRNAGLWVVFLIAAAILPVSHLVLGELSSFEKHLAYTVVFLGPIAGYGLAQWSHSRFVMAPPVILLVVLVLVAETRARPLVYWGDAQDVVAVIRDDPSPGTYLSTQASVLQYHTRPYQNYTQIEWVETFNFWAPLPDGESLIAPAIETGVFERVVIRSGETGSDVQDQAIAILLEQLVDGEYEELNVGGGWSIYTYTGERDAQTDAVAEQILPDPNERVRRPAEGEVPGLDGALASLSTDEAPQPEPEPHAPLHESLAPGDEGEAVTRWPTFLTERNHEALPEWGADGLYGLETAEWTERHFASRE